MARFLIDEDLPHLLARLLEQQGYPSNHVRDLNLRGSTDTRIFESAQQAQAVLVTGDSDFGNLLRFPLGSHSGIVVVRYPSVMRTRDLATRIAATLSALDESTFKGSLIILEPGRSRIRRAAGGAVHSGEAR
jgi:predicted nuclease of predicted toxin-antitoxin system